MQLHRLNQKISSCLQLPTDRLKLIHNGHIIDSDTSVRRINEEDQLLAVIAPMTLSKEVRQCIKQAAASDYDDDDDDIRYRLPANAPAWKKKIVDYLKYKLKIPDLVLVVAFAPGLTFYVSLLTWILASKVAAAFELGPPFVIISILALILLNLGKRKEGTLSAYSWFNPNNRNLPGALTAEEFDRQLRRGHI